MIFVDTNIVIDVSSNDSAWADWSQAQLDVAVRQDSLAVNDIIYAELCVGFEHISQVDALLARAGITVVPIPRRGLFLAGKAFLQYRRSGGGRTGVLPDFFIGAHAVVTESPLITRDPRRYRAYFPGVELIAPDIH